MSTLIQHINKTYFWDIDLNKLDENNSKRLIIERVINFISLFFNIPKTKFKCYIRKQLNNQPWNY